MNFFVKYEFFCKVQRLSSMNISVKYEIFVLNKKIRIYEIIHTWRFSYFTKKSYFTEILILHLKFRTLPNILYLTEKFVHQMKRCKVVKIIFWKNIICAFSGNFGSMRCTHSTKFYLELLHLSSLFCCLFCEFLEQVFYSLSRRGFQLNFMLNIGNVILDLLELVFHSIDAKENEWSWKTVW